MTLSILIERSQYVFEVRFLRHGVVNISQFFAFSACFTMLVVVNKKRLLTKLEMIMLSTAAGCSEGLGRAEADADVDVQ